MASTLPPPCESTRRPASPATSDPIRPRYPLAGSVRSRGDGPLGPWRAASPTTTCAAGALGLDFDDDGWEAIPVPGHWRSMPAVRRQRRPAPLPHPLRARRRPGGARHWVVLDGVFYQADVWLDGAYLGDPEGYFFPHAYEITDLARLAPEHVLAVEVTCAPQRDRRAKRNLTGVFQHWDCIDPTGTPAGCGGGCGSSGPGRCASTRMRVLCRDADAEPGQRHGPRRARQRRRPHGAHPHHAGRRRRARSSSTRWRGARTPSSGPSASTTPALWWPWALGDQPLAHLEVTVVGRPRAEPRPLGPHRAPAGGDAPLGAHRQRRAAVPEGRQPRPDPHGAGRGHSPDELRRDVALAARRRPRPVAGPRPHHPARALRRRRRARHAGLAGPPAAVGLRPHRSRQQAARQAAEAVDLLGHHPSIAIWCGHNEPVALDVRPGEPVSRPARSRSSSSPGRSCRAGTASILDARSSAPSSGPTAAGPWSPTPASSPHLPQLDGTDSHLYFGWYYGEERDLPGFAAAWPRMVRFVSEFGAQAVPDDAAFMEPERWPDLDWERLQRAPRAPEGGLRRAGPAGRLRHLRRAGRTPRSATRPRCCSTTSRPCAA